jgi:hypothetical protein
MISSAQASGGNMPAMDPSLTPAPAEVMLCPLTRLSLSILQPFSVIDSWGIFIVDIKVFFSFLKRFSRGAAV